jgi:hypothetical protein
MCFVFIWEQSATCATYNINWLVFITEMKSVYCAVWTGYLNKAVCMFIFKGLIYEILLHIHQVSIMADQWRWWGKAMFYSWLYSSFFVSLFVSIGVRQLKIVWFGIIIPIIWFLCQIWFENHWNTLFKKCELQHNWNWKSIYDHNHFEFLRILTPKSVWKVETSCHVWTTTADP